MAKPKTTKKPAKGTPSTKRRRGSAPKPGDPTRMPPEQLEAPGTERVKVDVLERLGRELLGHEADRKASADQAKACQKRIAVELRKLPPAYGCKYRIAAGRLLEVNVVDKVTAKATAKEPRKKRAKAGAVIDVKATAKS